MSNVQFLSLGAPPLPPGWSEHAGPAGQMYYYNSQTQESTYVRPMPAFPITPTARSELAKKEKPLVKMHIPGTDWVRVRTTEGNIFYSHKVKKESTWRVPEEIKDVVEVLERENINQKGDRHIVSIAGDESKLLSKVDSAEAEVRGVGKRKPEDMTMANDATRKKAKVEEGAPDAEESDESEEEEWQREAATQLAAEKEAEEKRREEEAEVEKRHKEAEARSQASQINMPERVDLSVEEAKALFKTLLREKDVNPLHPWDTSLPMFVSDPRYVLLPSVSVRREAFDDYCRDRARELRQSAVRKEKGGTNPKDEFDVLLRQQVQSTRTTWSDYRRTWKKDRRFYGWGRDDREREKRFREYLKELGESKRTKARKAEMDFFAMLRERDDTVDGPIWKDVKRKFHDDPRYEAVGSSSLREELFNTFVKGRQSDLNQSAIVPDDESISESGEVDERERQKERMERAVKQREERVQAERARVETDIGRSRRGIHKEEGEREFKSLLVDAVRDPQATWDAVLPQLKLDPRLYVSSLPINQQLHLFHDHIGRLRHKYISALHDLFENYAPSLANSFDILPLSLLLISTPVAKLGLDAEGLNHEFERWQRERTTEFRTAFDKMLAENSFVEFWGRLGKIGGEGVDGGVQADEMEEGEGEGGGGKVDMKALAKQVDVADVEKVLKNDKRYIMFDHVPDQRERWVRDYLLGLSAPKLSVHVPQAVS